MIVVTRKERDRLLRRGDILKAAEHVFADKGYHNATMQDIAREAQYATGTVYLYFKDKESLYGSLIDEKISAMVEAVRVRTAEVDDAGKKLGLFVDGVLAYFEENRDFFRIFIHERSRVEWTFKHHARTARLNNLPVITEIIRTGQKQGLLTEKYDAQDIAEILVSVLSSIVFRNLKQNAGNGSLRGMAGTALEIFLNGVRKR